MKDVNVLPLIGFRFHALGTQVTFISPAYENGAIQALVAGYEARFSRFRPDSELERIHRSNGSPVEASREMLAVLADAKRFWRETDGIFDPMIRPELERAGYDRTFDAVPKVEAADVPPAPERTHTFADVAIDFERAKVCLPTDAAMDLGGIAKAWIVDRVGDALSRHGPYLVDIGGDMAAAGDGPDGGRGWLISVTDPRSGGEICRLRLHDQAIATSTTAKRRWKRGGRWMHHIIDPRTGQPADSDLLQATVVARRAVDADVYAKTALILGAARAVPFLKQRGVEGLLVSNHTINTTAGWPAMGPAEAA